MNNYRKQRRNQEADEWLRPLDEAILREREFHKSSVSSCGFNVEALKRAIEDSKEVRAQALRNARQALEEAFSCRVGRSLSEMKRSTHEHSNF